MKSVSSFVNGFAGTKKLHMALVITVACVIMACAVFKASNASMTHDESGTYLNLVEGSTLNLWTCYKNPACWTTANNHLLNTLLIRWTVSIFGTTEFVLRLPNLLMLLLYLISVVFICRDTVQTTSQSLFGIALLTCNPFVLDFFALARGYGMGVGLIMLSLWAIWRYISNDKAVYIVFAFVAATASVFANLTCVAYLAALTGAFLLHVIIAMKDRRESRISGLIPVSIAACLIFLSWYFYRPVAMLIGLGEFDYGASSMWESWSGFARDSLYGVNWFGERTRDLVAITSALMIGVCMIAAWIPKSQEGNKSETEFGRFLSVLLFMFIAFFILSHVFTGAFYPSGRKTIIVFPLVALLVYFITKRFFGRRRVWSQMLMAGLSLFLFAHFVRAFNDRTYREWWYDASTKEMIHYVAAKSTPGDSISLGVEWIFHPSTHFYIQTRHLPVDLAPYSRDISKDNPVGHYYLHPDQAKVLEPEFVLEKNFEGRLLMIRVVEGNR